MTLRLVHSAEPRGQAVTLIPVQSAPPEKTQACAVLDLLYTSDDIDILGIVRVGVEEALDVSAWVQVLPDPQVSAYRDAHTGARRVEVSSGHENAPVCGSITVTWRCQSTHPFWTTLLTGHDVDPGDQREITPRQVLRAAAQLQLTQPPA